MIYKIKPRWIAFHKFYFKYLYWKVFILRRFQFFSLYFTPKLLLRLLGAKIGDHSSIHFSVQIQNADQGSCANLRIGNHVFIGPQCLFDISSPIVIEDDCAISAAVKMITHSDPGTWGTSPLHTVYPHKERPIVIQKGSWIGTSVTILDGVTIGPLSVVGAMSLVNKDIPERSLAVGVPAKTIRELAL